MPNWTSCWTWSRTAAVRVYALHCSEIRTHTPVLYSSARHWSSAVRAGELQLAVIQRGRDRFEVEVLDGLLRRACTVTEALEKATMQFDVRALAFSDCMGTRRSSTQHNSASATH